MKKTKKDFLYNQDFFLESRDKLTILLYHGVTKLKFNSGIRNRQGKHIHIDDFIKQMDYVKRYCKPITLDDWLSYKNAGEELPDNSVVISFDDGFRNNFTVAAPILSDRNIPAIFYVSSGLVSSNKMFWVDILEDCIEMSRKSSIIITLDKTIEFQIRNDNEKFLALLTIKKWCKISSNVEKNRVIEDVITQTEIKPSVYHDFDYEKISWSELCEMHKNSLFTIGGHSLNHNILSSLEHNLLNNEISDSIDLLKKNLKTNIKHYSYPEGQSNHYNSKVIDLLKSFGIICCPSAIYGINDISEDPFHLKRVMVGFDNIPFPYY